MSAARSGNAPRGATAPAGAVRNDGARAQPMPNDVATNDAVPTAAAPGEVGPDGC